MGEYVPNGSYKQTSREIKVTLSAECQKVDQTWQKSSLDITTLNQANIENINGVLTHVGTTSTPVKGYVPAGSYKQTSREIKVTLSAECQKVDQTWQKSSLDITKLVDANIENIDGKLVPR